MSQAIQPQMHVADPIFRSFDAPARHWLTPLTSPIRRGC